MARRISFLARFLISIGCLGIAGVANSGMAEVIVGVAAGAAVASSAAEKPKDCPPPAEPCNNYLCPPAIYNAFVAGGARTLPGCQDSCDKAIDCDAAGMPVYVPSPMLPSRMCARSDAGHNVFRLYFDTRQDTLDADKDRTQLEGLQSFVEANARCRALQVIGFADAPGKKAYNLALSQRRAQSVKQQVEHFTGSDTTVTVSAPQRCGEIGSARNQLNRRVDVHAFCE